jgi:hypothetical protein
LKVCLRGTLTWEPSALFKTLHHKINNSMQLRAQGRRWPTWSQCCPGRAW